METSVAEQTDPVRFVIAADGEAAGFAQCFDHDGRRIFFHTVVDTAFAGHRLATEVIDRALAASREEGFRIVAVCPLVEQHVERHADEWSGSVDRVPAVELALLPLKL